MISRRRSKIPRFVKSGNSGWPGLGRVTVGMARHGYHLTRDGGEG